MTERLHFHFSLSCTGEGNGNPLQCSCLENPRGRRAWWATVYAVAQSQTRLTQLSSSSSNSSSSNPKTVHNVSKYIYRFSTIIYDKVVEKREAYNKHRATGNGNPLQYSCGENLRDGGVWWAALSGVAQSRTRLRRLSSSNSSSSIFRKI